MNKKLKSCPFCNNEIKFSRLKTLEEKNIIQEDGGFYWVRCKKCDARGPSSLEFDIVNAITAWNTRHES
jgi:Lar family restriction alleviation protein